MGPYALHCFFFFLLFLNLSSGSGIDKMRPPSRPIQQIRKYYTEDRQIPYLYPDAATMRDLTPTTYPTLTPTDDTTPTIYPNPPGDTTPTTTTPTLAPTPPTTAAPTITQTPPTMTPTTPTFSPTPPTMTTPTITPTPPTMTTPTITPSPPLTMTPTTPTTTSPTTPTGSQTSSGGSWCVASSNASPTALQVALDYACGFGGADCSAIQPGASCYNPDTIKDHASYAFNQYYQKNPSPTACQFGGAAQLTTTDPSSGSCQYASSNTSSTSTQTPPMIQTPPTTDSPPSPLSPPITTTPIGGSTVYGGEPTASPNTAASMGMQSSLLACTAILLVYTLMGAHP